MWLAYEGLRAPLPENWKPWYVPWCHGVHKSAPGFFPHPYHFSTLFTAASLHHHPCSKTPAGEIYFFNFATGESQWDHPLGKRLRKGRVCSSRHFLYQKFFLRTCLLTCPRTQFCQDLRHPLILDRIFVCLLPTDNHYKSLYKQEKEKLQRKKAEAAGKRASLGSRSQAGKMLVRKLNLCITLIAC